MGVQGIKRIKSPDTEVEAVILAGDGGATTRLETYVVLVPTSGRVDMKNQEKDDIVFVANHLKKPWCSMEAATPSG